MQLKFKESDLTVAVLMNDLESAKEIATALRERNILTYLYQTLEEFWVSTQIEIPHLLIVDVTKMSQGIVQFRNHPKVLDKSLQYAFFSKESTKVLLQSTLGLNPVGYLHHDQTLNAQIMALVKMRAQEIYLNKEKAELEERIGRLQARSKRILSQRSDAEEFKSDFEFIRSFCEKVEVDSAKQDFTLSLIRYLEKWEAITGYGIYELNQGGQKLISPEISQKKYHPFPSLWLGHENLMGIEVFAQDMAIQVAGDLFETEPFILKIYAGASNPELLLFLTSGEERMTHFPWDILESLLSSSLRKLKLFQNLPHYTSQFLPLWEALDDMDKIQKQAGDSDTKVVALSLVPLTRLASKKNSNKFFWSAFFNDFFLQLSGRLHKETKLSLFGPWHILFFTSKGDLESQFETIQIFIQQFQYWKFFEDDSQILSQDMVPYLKLIPSSSAQYLRVFEKEFLELNLNEEQHFINSSISKTNRLSN